MIKLLLAATALTLAAPAFATPGDVAQARDILAHGVNFATVKGRGNVPAYAAYIKSVLVAGGFAPGDVTIEETHNTAILYAVYRGSGKKRPIAVAGHMDVVEANPKDWVRDPFTFIEDKGYYFGRGVSDDKFDVSMEIATLVRLKAEGFKPARDIHLFLSGDEETDGDTAKIQATQAKAAGVEFMLNGDSGGGLLDADGKPLEYSLSAAEKTYADFEGTITNPGGHSSLPTTPNAIVQMAAATERMAAYKFPAEISEITRASLKASGLKHGGPLGAAMAAYAANPKDAAAIAALRANPMTIGQIGTTCVPTMITGGHAPNALPQRVTVTINCRIWPGVAPEDVRKDLERAAAEPAMTLKEANPFGYAPPSPLRPDVTAAVQKAVSARFPGFSMVPGMDAGASDSVEYRALGIPSYGVSGLMMRGDEIFIHGLNERVPASAVAPALEHWHILLTELAK